MKKNIFLNALIDSAANKGNFNLYLISLILIIIGSNLYSQSTLRGQLIDSESNMGVPFAYIKLSGKNIFAISDADGLFTIEGTNLDTVIISHVAYKTLKIPYKGVNTSLVIKMSELPIELNPIIISARNAENTVRKAIDSTYSSLVKPMYFKCFRKDLITFHDTLIIEAKAEIFMELETLYSPSRGGKINCYLENIKVEKHMNSKTSLVPRFSISSTYAPINRFIAGVSKNDDKLLSFSYQEVNDSIIIICFKPKSGISNIRFVYKQGRFIINKNSGKFIRIDSNLSPEMMEFQRISMEKKKNPSLYYYNYSLSQFFDRQGYPQKIHWQLGFSFKENNPENLWTNYSDQFIVRLDYKPKSIVNKINVKSDTTLVEMKSHYNSSFESEFNKFVP
jgi:hypothetical protein